MSFLLLEAVNIEKYFADIKVLNVKKFCVYAGDRIGFVGANGSGKTTFLNILSGEMAPDDGIVHRNCEVSYIRQFAGTDTETVYETENMQKLGEYGVLDKTGSNTISGGEGTRIKIAQAFSGASPMVFADEPTANLDIYGIRQFSDELAGLTTFILISHDRALLNRHCNKIMALENHDIAIYEGDFDAYIQQVSAKREREISQYEQYKSERQRLENVYTQKKTKATKITKKPKGMSSSEMKQRNFIATSRSFDGRQKRANQAAKAVQSRISQMEVKERPRDIPRIKINFALTDPPHNKIVLSSRNLNFAYDKTVLFENANFEIGVGTRVALHGPNGSGKTTLLNLISLGANGIYRVPKARIGYFCQGFEQLDLNSTVLANAIADSVQSKTTVRTVLARLLFTSADIGKPAGVLSGGERVKLSLAKLLVSRSNVLLLDEPTNYLDMPSLEVMQSILQEYEGTILFVSHDRAFINAVCTDILLINDRNITAFNGNLDDYGRNTTPESNPDQLLHEYKLAAVAGKLANAKPGEKESLQAQYMELLRGV